MCHLKQCANGGTCVHTSDIPRCICAEGYYGDNCESKLLFSIEFLREILLSITFSSLYCFIQTMKLMKSVMICKLCKYKFQVNKVRGKRMNKCSRFKQSTVA